MNMDKVKRILDLFLDIPYPDDGHIAMGASIEAGYVRSYFREISWQKLSVEHLWEFYPGDPAGCLSFMTPCGFRYYFPGYMKMALLQYDSADAIFDAVMNKLSIAALDPNSELRSIFEKYEKKQLTGIAEFLTIISESIYKLYPVDIAEIAISTYWKRYLPP